MPAPIRAARPGSANRPTSGQTPVRYVAPGAVTRASRAPPMAYDPGYAALGGPAPIFVQAKPSWSRPGNVTAAGVIAFVVSGLAVFAAIFWFTTGEFVSSVDNGGGFFGDYAVKAQINAFANLGVALALVLGGIGTLGRQEWGRVALIFGAGGHAIYSAYRMMDRSFVSLVWIFLDVVIIVLIVLPTTSIFFRTRNPVQPVLYR
ncbi:MAG: hypothetical protein ABR562_02965 [Thermoplasmatota archaeon]|nr:hypothetical protein [Halobacteriales archaeon]